MSAHCIMHHQSVNQLMNSSSSDSKNKRHDQESSENTFWNGQLLCIHNCNWECDKASATPNETGNGPDFNLYSVADVLIIFCLVAFACLRAPQPYYRKFGRVIISRGRISTGEDKSYSSSFLHGNNLSMNVIPNWVFQSFCASLRLNWAF